MLEQKRIGTLGNIKKNEVITRIKALKKGNQGNVNCNQILAEERILSNLVEMELKRDLENYRKFETLNDEKITPYFMSLVKNSSKGDSPTQIKQENGIEFNSLDDLSIHVENYYKGIYRREQNGVETTTVEQIENFLGPEISSRPEVLNSKLSEEEKIALDSPLTLEELEKSINSANMKSAPGSNGISNRFIKKFWDFLKRPLLKCANHSFETGRLTDSFRTADIKLIPKKGSDLNKIKNWRPISLLNCFYKCISRAFASRIKKYMNKLTPCAQKGYSNGRYCQEVLMSVVDTIENCKAKKIKGGILCLDIKKAFDSLSHSYMVNVLKFYNFGPNILRWLAVLCTNRAARIVILNDISTNIFELERGNAQGDTLSPFLFNLGYQILLLKLEYDSQILGLIDEVEIPDSLLPLPVGISQVPPKVYALADDATVLTRMDYNSLLRVKTILRDFHVLSGLECNVDKTTLMQIGSSEPIPTDVRSLGFDMQNEVKLLGLKIKNNGNYYESIDNMELNISSQIRFWSRFNLSLPGRINVSKTFMYSQLNYLGCFLPLSEEKVVLFENLIENFVRGPLNISKERMTLTREEGGIGLFDIKKFLGAQSCCWAKRAQNLDDNWKLRLYAKSFGTTLNIRSRFYDPVSEPILYNIAKNFEIFLGGFTSAKENVRECFIFMNNFITYGGENPQTVGISFFGAEVFTAQKKQIGSILFSHILKEDGTANSHAIFEQKTSVRIGLDKYDSLRRICQDTLVTLENTQREPFQGKKTSDLITFCNRFKKGSKPFRKILVGPRKMDIPRHIVTFAGSTETIIGLEMSRHLGGFWGFNFLNNDMRMFLFKLQSGLLGLNNRVAHFIRDHSPICTFCRLGGRGDAPDETVLHLFFDCPATENIKDDFFRWYYNQDDNYFISRSELFLIQTENESITGTSVTKTLIAKTFLKYIWECKTRETLPNLNHCKDHTVNIFKNITLVSSRMREKIIDSGLSRRLLQG